MHRGEGARCGSAPCVALCPVPRVPRATSEALRPSTRESGPQLRYARGAPIPVHTRTAHRRVLHCRLVLVLRTVVALRRAAAPVHRLRQRASPPGRGPYPRQRARLPRRPRRRRAQRRPQAQPAAAARRRTEGSPGHGPGGVGGQSGVCGHWVCRDGDRAPARRGEAGEARRGARVVGVGAEAVRRALRSLGSQRGASAPAIYGNTCNHLRHTWCMASVVHRVEGARCGSAPCVGSSSARVAAERVVRVGAAAQAGEPVARRAGA